MSSDKDKQSNIKTFKAPGKEKKDKKKSGKGLYIGSVIVLVITVISFVLVPAMSGKSSSTGNLVFGKYKNRSIKYTGSGYFSDQLNYLNSQYQNQGIDNYDFRMMLVWRGAFEQTALHEALIAESESTGIKITSKEIDRAIVTDINGPFSIDGVFDEDSYKEAGQKRIKEIRDSYEEQKLIEKFSFDQTSGLIGNDKELEFLARMGETTRKFSFVTLGYEMYPSENVDSFYNANKDIFNKRTFQAIEFTGEKKEAEKLLSDVNNGNKPAEEQNGYSEEEKYLHELKRQMINANDVAKAFNADKEVFNGIYKTSYGWLILKPVSEITSLSDNITETVRSYLEKYEIGLIEDYLTDYANTIRTAAIKDGLASAATANDINSEETDFFPMNYGNLPFIFGGINQASQAKVFEQASFNKDFYKTAFNLEADTISEPLVMGKNVVLLSLLEEKVNDNSSFTSFISYYTYQFKDSDMKDVFLSSPHLEDNFSDVFSKTFNM